MCKSKLFCFISCALLLVVLVLPSSASFVPDDDLLLDYPIDIDYSLSPLSLSSSYYIYYGAVSNYTGYVPVTQLPITPVKISNTTSDWIQYIFRSYKGQSGTMYASSFIGIGIQGSFPADSIVTISWSGFSNGVYTSTGSVTGGLFYINGSPNMTNKPSFYLYDQDFNILGGPFSSSGQYVITLSSSVSSLIFGYYYQSSSATSNYYYNVTSYISNAASTLSYSVEIPPSIEDLLKINNTLLSSGNSTRSHIDSDMHQVITILQDMSSTAASDPMSQFEGRYIEKMEDQLNGVEDMLSSSNPALPNGGDFVGFADDLQQGFGVNGSSFNPSDFSSAAGSFSGSSSTSEGGPWEFFSQGVADSLAGGASSIGLEDDDYIYAWLEQSERRYSFWASFSP